MHGISAALLANPKVPACYHRCRVTFSRLPQCICWAWVTQKGAHEMGGKRKNGSGRSEWQRAALRAQCRKRGWQSAHFLSEASSHGDGQGGTTGMYLVHCGWLAWVAHHMTLRRLCRVAPDAQIEHLRCLKIDHTSGRAGLQRRWMLHSNGAAASVPPRKLELLGRLPLGRLLRRGTQLLLALGLQWEEQTMKLSQQWTFWSQKQQHAASPRAWPEWEAVEGRFISRLAAPTT